LELLSLRKSSNWGRGLQPRHASGVAALESQHRLTQLTQHATRESKYNTLYFMQKGTQPSQTFSGGQITPNPTKIDAGGASLLMGSVN